MKKLLTFISVPVKASLPTLDTYSKQEWQLISDLQTHYYILDSENKPIAFKDLLTFPGFLLKNSKNENLIQIYSEFYFKHKLDKIINPPRGCLDSGIIFIGYRPGEKSFIDPQRHPIWLYGPSAKLLIKLCEDLQILPYFTNIYKTKPLENFAHRNNWGAIINEELELLSEFNSEKLKIICLGTYEDYEKYINLQRFKVYKIWHPAFLLRARGERDKKYQVWKSELEKILSI